MTRNYAERRLTILVADFLQLAMPADIPWTHFPAGEFRTAQTGALLKRMGLKAGWNDFIFILPPHGQTGLIELKVGDGGLSKDQKAHEKSATKAGAKWAECRTLDEVQQVLGIWGIQLRATI